MLNAKVALQPYYKFVAGRAKQRELGPEGNIVGRYDASHMMKSMIYEVDFPDGQVKDYAVNVIAENMLSQVDEKGYIITLIN